MVEIKAPNSSAVLRFSEPRRTEHETWFTLHFEDTPFSGAVTCSSYIVGAPDAFFREIAAEWKGWSGEKTWVEYDSGTARLRAENDGCGHILLEVELEDPQKQAFVRGSLMLEAGSLESIAQLVSHFFAPHS